MSTFNLNAELVDGLIATCSVVRFKAAYDLSIRRPLRWSDSGPWDCQTIDGSLYFSVDVVDGTCVLEWSSPRSIGYYHDGFKCFEIDDPGFPQNMYSKIIEMVRTYDDS